MIHRAILVLFALPTILAIGSADHCPKEETCGKLFGFIIGKPMCVPTTKEVQCVYWPAIAHLLGYKCKAKCPAAKATEPPPLPSGNKFCYDYGLYFEFKNDASHEASEAFGDFQFTLSQWMTNYAFSAESIKNYLGQRTMVLDFPEKRSGKSLSVEAQTCVSVPKGNEIDSSSIPSAIWSALSDENKVDALESSLSALFDGLFDGIKKITISY